MSNEKVTELPSVTNATAADVIYAVQAGNSVQETLQQVLDLNLSYVVLTHSGNPNGAVAGTRLQFCFDSANNKIYICTTSGSSTTAIWTLLGALVVAPLEGGTGVSNPTARSVPVAQGSSNFVFKTLNNGQLLIGSNGADPVVANLVAGPNMVITNNAGSITLESTGAGAGFTWNNVTGATQTLDVSNGYLVSHSGGVAFTLPSSSALFDEIEIRGDVDSWSIAQGAGQYINVNSATSTVGTGGSVSSSNAKDGIRLICVEANLGWSAKYSMGTLTIV